MQYFNQTIIKRILIIGFFLFLHIPGYAQTISYQSSLPGTTSTYGSVPYSDNGFSYSDGEGNSFSQHEIRSIPVTERQYPNANQVWWVYGNYLNGR